jgi:superfamily II DNA or RNA helicase
MYDYQTEANTALYNHFIRDNGRAGILSMPTGSGKTRVATRFLIETMVADGWQVVWLTHRAMLIEQTADSVYNSAGSLLRKAAPDKSTFKMVCVSGSHASIKATERDDDVMVCGVQSLIRNLPYLHAVLGKKVMIIVDEAHHTLAPSYRLIIKEIQKIASDVKLLG